MPPGRCSTGRSRSSGRPGPADTHVHGPRAPGNTPGRPNHAPGTHGKAVQHGKGLPTPGATIGGTVYLSFEACKNAGSTRYSRALEQQRSGRYRRAPHCDTRVMQCCLRFHGAESCSRHNRGRTRHGLVDNTSTPSQGPRVPGTWLGGTGPPRYSSEVCRRSPEARPARHHSTWH